MRVNKLWCATARFVFGAGKSRLMLFLCTVCQCVSVI